MGKLPYNELIKSMSMFFTDENIDNEYIIKREKFSTLADEMSEIDSRIGLEKYIRSYEDSVDKLLILLGISGEYFKRITSFFRRQRGFEFRTEWGISAFRRFILTDSEMMNKTLDLFIEADDNSDLARYIPKYRLSSFKITQSVMKRLGNNDFLRFLFSKELDTSFNNATTNSKVKLLEDILRNICTKKGFVLNKSENIDVNGNNTRSIPINYTISKPEKELPSYYICFSFYLTTSKGQTSFKNNVKNLRDYIVTHNPNARQIIVLDGAGWIGRQGDLQDVWDYSNYCINLSYLNELNEIIK